MNMQSCVPSEYPFQDPFCSTTLLNRTALPLS